MYSLTLQILFQILSQASFLSSYLIQPHAGYGVVRIDPLCILAKWHKRQLNQVCPFY